MLDYAFTQLLTIEVLRVKDLFWKLSQIQRELPELLLFSKPPLDRNTSNARIKPAPTTCLFRRTRVSKTQQLSPQFSIQKNIHSNSLSENRSESFAIPPMKLIYFPGRNSWHFFDRLFQWTDSKIGLYIILFTCPRSVEIQFHALKFECSKLSKLQLIKTIKWTLRTLKAFLSNELPYSIRNKTVLLGLRFERVGLRCSQLVFYKRFIRLS